MERTLLILLCCCCLQSLAFGWGSNEKQQRVRLQDVQVLTLHQGKMTTGRRSSPVPQLNCVGGSAKGLFNPQVVQCYNRGWDGMDVQWECKTDLDMDYRLGSVNVICEGYDYPDDPYILAGSCGLEYTLELTKQGRDQQNSNKGSSYSSYGGNSYSGDGYGNSYGESRWKGLSDLILLSVVCIVIYAIYKTCIDSQEMGDRQYSSTGSDGHPGGGGGWANPGYGGGSNQQQHQQRPGGDYGGDASCGGGARQRGTGAGGLGGGNFWTGAGVGGLLGYMMGNRNNTGYGYGGYNRGYGGYNRGYGGGGFGGTTFRSGGGGGGASSSGGTRTASGFGGTSRR